MSEISAFSPCSDGIGSAPASASRSCTTTKGMRHAWQIRAKTGMFDFPPHSTIETSARSASWPSAAKTDGSTSFSVRPSTRIADRARKSSLRSASNSLTIRKASSDSSGSGCTTCVPRSGSCPTSTSSSRRATFRKAGACVE